MTEPNAEQVEYWNEQGGPRWVALQTELDEMLEPLGREGLDAIAPAPGEAAIDVGCGCGATTLALAERVTPGGRVLGVDPSQPMLALARERSAGLDSVEFACADAQTHDFGDASFDLVFSRFGVMFFADPVAAFENLRRALVPGGRLGFVCWQTPALNGWATLPMQAVLRHVAPPPPPEPGAPGPFAFADADRPAAILRDAGWVDVQVESSTGTLSLGGGADLEESIEFALHVGPGSRLLLDASEETRAAARESVRKALEPFASDDGIRLPRATWIVTARKA